MSPDKKPRPFKLIGGLRELSRVTGRMNLPSAALGFLMGRAVILENLSPFGLAHFAAVACLMPAQAALNGIAVMAGVVSASGWAEIPQWGSNLLLLYLMIRAAGTSAGTRLPKAAGAAFVARVTVRTVILIAGEFNPYAMMVIIFEGLLCAALTGVFALGLRALQAGTPFARPYSPEETTCAAVLAACAVAGIGGLRAGPVMAQNVIGCALTATIGWVAGSSAGASAGVAAGLIAALSGTAQPGFVGVQALSGLMSGMFRELGKLGSFSGFVLGSVAMGMYANSPSLMVQSMMEAVAGSAVVLVIPGAVAQTLRRVLNQSQTGYAAVKTVAVEAPVARLRGYSMALREISRAFDQAYALPKEEPDKMPRMFGAVASRVCERCRDYRRCWEADFRATYRAMFDLIRRAEESGSIPVDGPDAAGALRCRFPDRIALSLNHLVEIEKTARRWQRRVAEGRGILEGQMRMASRLMDEIASELAGGGRPTRQMEPRRLAYGTGIAQANKNGVKISGDSALVRDLPENRLLVALSDGMGAGASAAEESKAAVRLIETLMGAGFDRETAVGTVNSVLVARGTGEVFATLDMMHVDLTTCDAEFVKIGACPSFIWRDNEVVVIRAQSLPAGILSDIPVETVHHKLAPDDTVVLVTDGVLQARKDPSKKEPWLASFLARLRWMPAQELADRILERAGVTARGAGEEIKDDMTVVVVQFPGM